MNKIRGVVKSERKKKKLKDGVEKVIHGKNDMLQQKKIKVYKK